MKTRLSILSMIVILVVFSGCATNPPTIQQTIVPCQSVPSSVTGTTWVGIDSEGHYYEYHFQADGALHYNSPTGFWKNGTWKQDGNTIYMEMNNKYSERQGLICGSRMEGKAWNTKGEQWTWVAEKK